MTLGDYIKNYRMEHELSQRKFAALCGLSYGYISMLEKGVNTSTGDPIVPTLQTMRSLAKAMGTTIHNIARDVDDLYLDLTGEEKPPAFFKNLQIFGEEKQPAPKSELSEDEAMLLDLFRSLPEDERKSVLLLLRRAAGRS